MSSLKELLKVISGLAPASASTTTVKKSDLEKVKDKLLSHEMEFKDGKLVSDKEGESDDYKYLKELLNLPPFIDLLIYLIDANALTVVPKQTPYGKVKQLENPDYSLTEMKANFYKDPSGVTKPFNDIYFKGKLMDVNNLNYFIKNINKYPSILNETLRSKINASANLKAPASASTGGVKTTGLNAMAGGSMEGEFEAIQNTFAMEKATMEMIGGAEFAPALAPAATQKARLYQEMFDKLVEQLKQNDKALQEDDSKAIQDAIDGLARKERESTVLLEYLKQYVAIIEENKDDEKVKKELETKDIQTIVGKYFKTLKRVEKKSAKILGVLGDLTSSVAILPVMH